MLSPISTSNCTEAVENAHRDNIATVAVNNEFNGADMFIGPNSYDEGVVAADWANENIGDGECAIIMGLAGTDVVKNRTNGFTERLEELGSKIKGTPVSLVKLLIVRMQIGIVILQKMWQQPY